MTYDPKSVKLVQGKDAYGESFVDVIFDDVVIGTMWADDAEGEVNYESAIIGRSWACDTAAMAIEHLIEVYEENLDDEPDGQPDWQKEWEDFGEVYSDENDMI